MKVEFIKRATPIGLGYAVGSTADFESAYANELIEMGYCKPIEEVKQAVEKKPEEVETMVDENLEVIETTEQQKPKEVKQAVSKKKTK